MISNRRHTETAPNGDPIYIIKAYLKEKDMVTGVESISHELNRDFEKRRYGITFHRGVGRTTHRMLAQWMSEQFQMVVELNENVEPWIEAITGKNTGMVEIPDSEGSYYEESVDDEGTSQDDYATLGRN